MSGAPRACRGPGGGGGPGRLFYTDRIGEARDRSGRFYSFNRIAALDAGRDLDATLDRLRDYVICHVGHQLLDDAATLLVSPHPADR